MISLLSHNGIFPLGEFTAYIYILTDIHGLQRDFAQKPVHYFCPAATRNPGAYLSHFPLLSRRKKQIDRHSQSPIMAIQMPIAPMPKCTARIYPATSRSHSMEIIEHTIGYLTSFAARRIFGMANEVGHRKIAQPL